MGNNIPRRHHYVPRLLLRNFTNSAGQLWVFDANQKKNWQASPDSAGFERDLYARNLKSPEPEFSAIEEFLSQQVDGPGAEAIASLLARQRLSGEQEGNFLVFVAAQMLRTPAAFECLHASEAPMFQEMFERMANFDPEFREGVSRRLLKSGASQQDIDRVFQSIRDGKSKVNPSRDFVLRGALRLVEPIADELSKMRWAFLAVAKGEADLIIGDHPVLLTNPDSSRPFGLRTPTIELWMPLSRRMVACARHDGPDSYGELARGMSDLINERTLRHSRRFVFASAPSKQLRADAIRLCGTGPKMHTRRIRIGDGLMIVNEFCYVDEDSCRSA